MFDIAAFFNWPRSSSGSRWFPAGNPTHAAPYTGVYRLYSWSLTERIGNENQSVLTLQLSSLRTQPSHIVMSQHLLSTTLFKCPNKFSIVRWICVEADYGLSSWALGSPAMGHWGTCLLRLKLFNFCSFRPKSWLRTRPCNEVLMLQRVRIIVYAITITIQPLLSLFNLIVLLAYVKALLFTVLWPTKLHKTLSYFVENFNKYTNSRQKRTYPYYSVRVRRTYEI